VYFKICGIKEIETIKCCIKNNVKFFGLIFYNKSPRYISLKEALNLVNFSKNKNIKPVGVFVNEDLDIVENALKKLNLKYIQLHGNEDDFYISKIKENYKIKIIKSISLSSNKDLFKIEEYKQVDFFLFDYKPKNNELPGGNAKSFDWKIIHNFRINKPWFISGGINKENIKKIKNFANPDGIDLSSGVEESPGVKNIEMINSFFKKYHE
tara:strand:+ start:153 stop:782 length:630 start_codon:yes stop_codon:yes gene_type:complete